MRQRTKYIEKHRTVQEGIKGIYSCRQILNHLSYLGSPEDRDPELPIEEEIEHCRRKKWRVWKISF